MRKRVIAGILTVVMVVSSLQLQTGSVLAKNQYPETGESSLVMEAADAKMQMQGEESAVEDTETESETDIQGEGSATEDTDTKSESGTEGEETPAEDTESGSEKQEEESNEEASKEDEIDSETEGESPENGEESAATEDTDAESEGTEEEANVEDAEEDETGIEADEVEKALVTSETDIASGEYGSISWVIDENGKLTVEGTGNFAPVSWAMSAPWCSYGNSIISAEIKVTGMTCASRMFCDCNKLTSVDLSGFDMSKVTDMSYMFYGCRSLTSVELSGFKTSKVTDMSYMFSGCRSLNSIDLGGFDTSEVTGMSGMFSDCSSLTSIDLSGLDTSKVAYMGDMFGYCESLTSVDLSGLNTRNVTDMRQMFLRCESLTSVNLSGLDTRNVTDMSWMFFGCNSLTSVDLSGLDTGNVTDMSYMFYGCSRLSSVDASGLDTGKVTDIEDMFYDCSSLTTIYTPYNLSQSVDLPRNSDSDIWYNCDGTEFAELPRNLDYSIVIMKNEIPSTSKITVTKTKTVYVCGEPLNTDDLTVCCYDNRGAVTKVTEGYSTNAGNIDMLTMGKKTLEVTYNGMTAEVEIIVGIYTVTFTGTGKDDIAEGTPGEVNGGADYTFTLIKSGDYTYTVTATMGGNPITISPDESGNAYTISNVSGNLIITIEAPEKYIASGGYIGDDSNVAWYIDIKGKLTVEGKGEFTRSYDLDYGGNGFAFKIQRAPWSSYCASITSAEIKVKGMTDASAMFVSCKKLTSVDLSGFDTSKVTDMWCMFYGCERLTSVDLSGLDTSRVTDMWGMFNGCKSLTSVDLSGLDISKVTDMNGMFSGCDSLTSVDLSGLDAGNVTDMGSMFSDCENLTSADLSGLDARNVTNMGSMFSNCHRLNSVNVSGLDTRNVTNMSDMFYYCYGLTGLDLSGLDTGSVIDMSGMFYFCGNLTSLDLRGLNIGNVTNVNMMFYTCNSLTTIYTPCNLSQSVELPKRYGGDIWYNCDGTELTELPQNLDYSIVIMKNKKPAAKNTISVAKTKTAYECGDTLNIDDLTVCYYNDKGAVVKVTEGYTTNANDIDMSTSGKKILRITYNGLTAKVEIIVGQTGGGSQEPEDESGLEISFEKEGDTESEYTGAAIKPEIKVTYNGKRLTSGTDYTIKYINNIKVGTAKITVTGKGNFARGNSTTTFEIVPRNIADVTLCGIATDDDNKETLTLANGSKLTPVLYFNNIKLTNKDYVIKDASGTEISGKKLGDSDNNATIKIEGKSGGNFTGSREIKLNVVDKKNLTKFTVTVVKDKLNTLSYDGNPHYIHEISGAITVTTKDSAKTNMDYGRDYTIVYPSDVTSAGTKKFTVVGMGLYTGSVSKSYTIKPAKEAALSVYYGDEMVTGNKISTPFTFASSGVTFGNELSVIIDNSGAPLSEGKDYKVAYSGNKQVNAKAKCIITFLGNYKGHTKQVIEFAIEKADLHWTEVIIADKAYTGNAGIYKSAPYVIEYTDDGDAGVLVKASNYKTTYYIDDPYDNDNARQMKGKNKVGDGDTVWVKIEAKGKNYEGVRVVSYKVREAQDLSKARITFKDAEGNTVNKMPYTGNKITDKHIKAVVNGNLAEDDADIEVIYVNNINKGKATVIIKGTDTAGCEYAGCKTATFSIVARSFSF